MKIKEGKKYILRDGTVTGKLSLHLANEYPFWCRKNNISFTINGAYSDDVREHRHDIVAKYKKRKK